MVIKNRINKFVVLVFRRKENKTHKTENLSYVYKKQIYNEKKNYSHVTTLRIVHVFKPFKINITSYEKIFIGDYYSIKKEMKNDIV